MTCKNFTNYKNVSKQLNVGYLRMVCGEYEESSVERWNGTIASGASDEGWWAKVKFVRQIQRRRSLDISGGMINPVWILRFLKRFRMCWNLRLETLGCKRDPKKGKLASRWDDPSDAQSRIPFHAFTILLFELMQVIFNCYLKIINLWYY